MAVETKRLFQKKRRKSWPTLFVRIEQLLVARQRRLVRPPLRRKLHRREAGLDRGQQHPDHRHGGVEQHEHEEDAPGPPPAVDALAACLAATAVSASMLMRRAPFVSLPLSART